MSVQEDKVAIDQVAARFFDAFTNRDGRTANVDRLYQIFVPEAIVVKNAGEMPEVFDLAGFVEPRRTLLAGGTVIDFCEKEIFERTEILGNVAQRFSLYRKSWTEAGQAFEGRGVKTLQFVRTPDGWKIASLAWDDERVGLAVPDRVAAFTAEEIPVVETERLRLRPHRPDDFRAALAMWTHPEVTRYIGGKPSTEQQTWMRMLTYSGHWAFMGFGYWAIEEKATGRFVGDIGFADFRRGALSSMEGVPELGWALDPAFHGRGFATEAARAALVWADAHFEAGRTVCLIDEENVASVRVAEKCGFREFERTIFNERPTMFLERHPPAPSSPA